MKIKPCYQLRTVAGENIVMVLGEESKKFNGVIMLNDTSAFLWKTLQDTACEKEQLVQALLDVYDVDEETAKKGVDKFVSLLEQHQFCE